MNGRIILRNDNLEGYDFSQIKDSKCRYPSLLCLDI